MKGIRTYLVIFGLLAALAVYFFLSRRTGTYRPSEVEFAVTDTGRIVSVRISSPEGELNLDRMEGRWTLNGYGVRTESIRALYMLLSRLEAGAPASGSAQKRIRGELSGPATRVRILMADRREKAYRVYFDSLSASTYMIMEGADIPFRVRVRGYRHRNLQELYRTDAGYWRDNHIFQCLSREIMHISLLNNRDPEKSFQLSRNGEGDFELAGGQVPSSWVSPSEESVNRYLGYFYDVRFESFLDPDADTLHHSETPDYVIKVELANRERIGVRLFPVFHRKAPGTGYEPDYNIFYARLDEGEEWVVVKYIQIDPLLKDFKYFTGP